MRVGSLCALLLAALLGGCAAYPAGPVYGGGYAGPVYGAGYGYAGPPVVGGVVVGGYRPWVAPPPVYRPPVVGGWGRPPGYWGGRPIAPGGWAGRPGGWVGRPGGWGARPYGGPR